MIWYFRESLHHRIKVEIEQRGQKLNSFEELVKKAVGAKAKAALWPRSYICKTNQYYFRGSQSSAAKASTQDQPIKDPRFEKPKSKPQELKAPAPHRSNHAETSERARKEKKETFWNIDNSANQTMSPLEPLQPPGVTQLTTPPEDLRLKKTSARLSVTTITKRNTMQPSIPSHQRLKTSTGLGNLRINDWGL